MNDLITKSQIDALRAENERIQMRLEAAVNVIQTYQRACSVNLGTDDVAARLRQHRAAVDGLLNFRE